MIKCVAFDLGGVLFAEGKSVAIAALKEKHGYEEEIISHMFNSSKSVDLRNGLITSEEFWSWVQMQVPEGYDAQVIRHQWLEGYILDDDILTLLQTLRERYRIIAFSGNMKERIAHLEHKYDFRKYFHHEVYSFDHNVGKPTKRFVEIMISVSGGLPEEIVYIDDSAENLAPATELGVHTAQYSRGEIQKLKQALEAFGIVV